MNNAPQQEGTSSVLPCRQKRIFWLWVAVLGLLFSIGACCVTALLEADRRARVGWGIATAREIVNLVILYHRENGAAPESPEAALRHGGYDESEIEDKIGCFRSPTGERK